MSLSNDIQSLRRPHLHKKMVLQIAPSSLDLPFFFLGFPGFFLKIIHSLSSGFKLLKIPNLLSQVSPLSDPLTGLIQVSSPKLLQTNPARSCGHPSFPVDQYSWPSIHLALHLGHSDTVFSVIVKLFH